MAPAANSIFAEHLHSQAQPHNVTTASLVTPPTGPVTMGCDVRRRTASATAKTAVVVASAVAGSVAQFSGQVDAARVTAHRPGWTSDRRDLHRATSRCRRI